MEAWMKAIAESGQSQSGFIDKDEQGTALCMDFRFAVPFGVTSAETIPVIFALPWTTYPFPSQPSTQS